MAVPGLWYLVDPLVQHPADIKYLTTHVTRQITPTCSAYHGMEGLIPYNSSWVAGRGKPLRKGMRAVHPPRAKTFIVIGSHHGTSNSPHIIVTYDASESSCIFVYDMVVDYPKNMRFAVNNLAASSAVHAHRFFELVADQSKATEAVEEVSRRLSMEAVQQGIALGSQDRMPVAADIPAANDDVNRVTTMVVVTAGSLSRHSAQCGLCEEGAGTILHFGKMQAYLLRLEALA